MSSFQGLSVFQLSKLLLVNKVATHKLESKERKIHLSHACVWACVLYTANNIVHIFLYFV